MIRTRFEQPLRERLRALREIRDAMLQDADKGPEAERDATRAYAYAVHAIRVATEKWLDRNQELPSMALGSCLMGAALQVIQTSLLVSSNNKAERSGITGRFINHMVQRFIQEKLIVSPGEARASGKGNETGRQSGLLGPDGKTLRVQ